jgi:hypothetical protein
MVPERAWVRLTYLGIFLVSADAERAAGAPGSRGKTTVTGVAHP